MTQSSALPTALRYPIENRLIPDADLTIYDTQDLIKAAVYHAVRLSDFQERGFTHLAAYTNRCIAVILVELDARV